MLIKIDFVKSKYGIGLNIQSINTFLSNKQSVVYIIMQTLTQCL